MQPAARPYITATAALATASVIAVTPVMTAPLPGIQMPAIQLTALSDIQNSQIDSLQALVTQELASDHSLVASESHLEQMLVGDGSALSALSGVQNSLNGLLGANFDAADIHSGLLTSFDPPGGIVFDTGNTGGLAGLYDQSLLASADISGLPGIEALQAVEAAVQAFDTHLVNSELAFNQQFVDAEVAAEQQVFGSNNALNGLVDHLYNVDNMLLYANENFINSLLGANSDAGAIHDSLLGVGGNAFDQTLAALADIAGFSSADWATLAGLTPADYVTLFDAANFGGFFTDVLASQDWSSLFLSLTG